MLCYFWPPASKCRELFGYEIILFHVERLGPGTNTKHKSKGEALDQSDSLNFYKLMFIYIIHEYAYIGKFTENCTL